MNPHHQRVLNRLNSLLRDADELLARSVHSGSSEYVNRGGLNGLKAATKSLFVQLYPHGHPIRDSSSLTSVLDRETEHAEAVRRLLLAAKGELEDGLTERVETLVAADLFSDFLDMAEHLLDGGYKDAAAVMIGSVLEEHLRRVCQHRGLPVTSRHDGRDVPRKADTLNTDLLKAQAYASVDHKAVTSWLGLRNAAAHGKYTDYASEQVRVLLFGVRDFVARVR